MIRLLRPEWPRSDLALMSWVLALGIIVHKTSKADWATSVWSLAITVAVLGLLLRPNSVRLLVVVYAGAIGQTVVGFDLKGNHWIFVSVVGAGIIGAALHRWVVDREEPTTEALEPTVFPFLRASWIVLWVFIVLAKANRGFFDTTHGCAVDFYEGARNRFLILPDLVDTSVAWLVPAAVFGLELAVPVLLVFRRTRLLGVAAGFVFHYLSGNAVPSFGAVALAFYVPFLPAGMHQLVRTGFTRLTARVPLVGHAWALVLVPSLLIAGTGVTRDLWGRPDLGSQRPAVAFFLVVAPFLALLTAWSLWCARTTTTEPKRFRPAAALLAIVVVVGLNGTLPYLGVKTENSYSMFSNLRTEVGTWNHLIVPESVRIVDHQDELVAVLETNVDGLTEFEDKLDVELTQLRWVDHDLRRILREHCAAGDADGALLVYRPHADGPVRRVDDACTEPELLVGGGIVWDRLWLFRPIPDDNGCQH